MFSYFKNLTSFSTRVAEKRCNEKCIPAVLFIQFVNLKAQKLLVTKEEGVKTCVLVCVCSLVCSVLAVVCVCVLCFACAWLNNPSDGVFLFSSIQRQIGSGAEKFPY